MRTDEEHLVVDREKVEHKFNTCTKFTTQITTHTRNLLHKLTQIYYKKSTKMRTDEEHLVVDREEVEHPRKQVLVQHHQDHLLHFSI